MKMRYLPSFEFPLSPYRPGWNDRPVESFSFESLSLSSLFLGGVDCFNEQYWWEAHEWWEELWNRLGRASEKALFVQGCILASAGYLKCECEQFRSARTLWGKAYMKLNQEDCIGDLFAIDTLFLREKLKEACGLELKELRELKAPRIKVNLKKLSI